MKGIEVIETKIAHDSNFDIDVSGDIPLTKVLLSIQNRVQK